MDEVSGVDAGSPVEAVNPTPSKRGMRYSTGLKAEVAAFLLSQAKEGKVPRGAYKEAQAKFGVPYLTARAALKKAQG